VSAYVRACVCVFVCPLPQPRSSSPPHRCPSHRLDALLPLPCLASSSPLPCPPLPKTSGQTPPPLRRARGGGPAHPGGQRLLPAVAARRRGGARPGGAREGREAAGVAAIGVARPPGSRPPPLRARSWCARVGPRGSAMAPARCAASSAAHCVRTPRWRWHLDAIRPLSPLLSPHAADLLPRNTHTLLTHIHVPPNRSSGVTAASQRRTRTRAPLPALVAADNNHLVDQSGNDSDTGKTAPSGRCSRSFAAKLYSSSARVRDTRHWPASTAATRAGDGMSAPPAARRAAATLQRGAGRALASKWLWHGNREAAIDYEGCG
jgi:hypothetical protein